jgi:tetratricopeptide (TPR) repeat protein
LSEKLQRANRHLAAGEIGAAKLLLDEATRDGADDTGLLRLLEARIVEAEGQPAQASTLFRQAAAALRLEVENLPNAPHRTLALAQALIKCGDAEGAEDLLSRARRNGVNAQSALRTERHLAFFRNDWLRMRRAAEKLIASEASPSSSDLVALAVACRNLNDLDGAADAAARALERDPTELQAGMIAASVAMHRGNAEGAIAHYRNLFKLTPNNPRLAFQFIRLLIVSGEVRDGESELAVALVRWPNDPSLRAFALICGFRSVEQIAAASDSGTFNIETLRERQLRKLVELAPGDAELRRPIIADDKAKDLIVAEANADTGVLVFTALSDVVSMPLPIFDRYLAALGVTAIYLKDFQRLFYLNGIASLGDNYNATIVALREICNRLSVRCLCTLGCSAGGSAAIRYGVELGAARLLSFAGETHHAVESLTELDHGAAMIKRRVTAKFPFAHLDLKEFLLSRNSSSKIEVVYPEETTRDKAQALYLAGIRGVTLHPVACGDHELLRWLALHDDLRALLVKLLGLRPIE